MQPAVNIPLLPPHEPLEGQRAHQTARSPSPSVQQQKQADEQSVIRTAGRGSAQAPQGFVSSLISEDWDEAKAQLTLGQFSLGC